MTLTSLIVARYIAVNGRPRADRESIPTAEEIIGFCQDEFRQVPSQTIAHQVRVALRAVQQ